MRYRRAVATQAERRASTVAAITRAAKELFTQRGFAATPVDEIVTKAGVTKGAFYHHFTSKEDVFASVLEEMQEALVGRVLAGAASGTDALARLKRGCGAFLTACADPAVQRIVLLDGPAVLGWEKWREVDSRYFGALFAQGIRQAIAEGLLAPRPVEPLVQLLIGASTEAAMVCARSRTPRKHRAELMAGLEALLDGLR
jgi:AcrR family transcriptional regulator